VHGEIVEESAAEPVALEADLQHRHDRTRHPDAVHEDDGLAHHSVFRISTSASRFVHDHTSSIASSIGSQRDAQCSVSWITGSRTSGRTYCHSYSILTVTPSG